MRGACSTSAAGAGRTARSAGTGAAAPVGSPTSTSSASSSAAKWTEGTGFTENGVIVDGRLTKLGHELRWTYDWDDPLTPWRVERSRRPARRSMLTPRFDKHTKVEALVLRSETHQVFGTWSGSFTTDEARSLTLEGLQGFAEESRSRW